MSQGRAAEPTTDRGSGSTGRQPATARVRNPDAGGAQPKFAEPGSGSPTGGHPLLQLQERQGNQAVQQVVKERISPKLAVGKPNDRYEREADRVAEQVMRMSEPAASDGESDRLRSNPAPTSTRRTTDRPTTTVAGTSPERVQRMCSRCERRASRGKPLNCPECEAELRRKESSGSGQPPTVNDETARAISSRRGRGDPLSRSTREFFEPRFGYDLSGISIHTGSRATELSRSLDARAFTVGRDIFFRAGAYQPGSAAGRQLLAHELTHTIQQGAVRSPRTNPTATTRPTEDNHPTADGPRDDTAQRRIESGTAHVVNPALPAVTSGSDTTMVQRVSLPSVSDIETGIESIGEDVAEVGDDLVEWGSETAESALEAGGEALEWGEEMLVEIGGDAVEVARDVWAAVQALAEELGATVSFAGGRLVVSIPTLSACPTIPVQFTLPEIAREGAFVKGILPITGTISLTGSVGYHLGVTPEILGQVGPCELQSTQVVVDPLGGEYSTSGQLAVTLALGLGAEARVGLEGEVGMLIIIPATPPIPIELPVVGLEGGLAGMARGTLAERVTIGGTLSYANGNISLTASQTEDLGVGLDLGLAGYGQLELLGNNLCRLYWPFWQRHYGATMSTVIDARLALGRGGVDASLNVAPPQFNTFPFSDFGLELRQQAFMDDCPLCDLFADLGVFPGGIDDHPEYRPDEWKKGPLTRYQVYDRSPYNDDKSDIVCRGACGPNCETCNSLGTVEIPAENREGVWVYENFEECFTHQGCRDHDACYDWAFDQGETGERSIPFTEIEFPSGKKHRLCDFECICTHSVPQCANWISGKGAYESMYFSEEPRFESGSTETQEQEPGDSAVQDVEPDVPTEEPDEPIPELDECAKPADLGPGLRIFLINKNDFARVIGVAHADELGFLQPGPNVWFIEYKLIRGGKESDGKEFTVAHDTDCNPTYTTPSIHKDCKTTYDWVDVPVRSPGGMYQRPQKKAKFVKSYPLCPSVYLKPYDNPAGYTRLIGWVRAHLLNGQLSGPGGYWNLVPTTTEINNKMKADYETGLRKKVELGLAMGDYYWFSASVRYHDDSDNPNIGHYDDFVKEIEISYGVAREENGSWELDEAPSENTYVFELSDEPEVSDVKKNRMHK